MSRIKPNELLAQAGTFLYGDRWQSALATIVERDRRTIARWAAGEFKIPADAWLAIYRILLQRQDEAMRLLILTCERASTVRVGRNGVPPSPAA